MNYNETSTETNLDAGTEADHGLVDWGQAVNVGAKIVRPGPRITREQGQTLVAGLHQSARDGIGPVLEVTKLAPQPTHPGLEEIPTIVVDRPGWLTAAASSMAALTTKPGPSQRPIPAAAQEAAGYQAGLVLAFVSSKVLGQYDPYYGAHGRLILVAPNILNLDPHLSASSRDVHLWIALHEQTHALQFAAAPWLRGHITSLAHQLIDAAVDKSDAKLAWKRLWGLLQTAYRALRNQPGPSVIDSVLTPQEQEILAQVTAVMSLLEGHADYMMDQVGSEHIQRLDTVRSEFEARRGGVKAPDRVARAVLGLDTKLAQYRDGAAFVRQVCELVGVEQFNAVWQNTDSIPTVAELADPPAWVTRVLN